ncbi:MAG: NTP transferase domain-containing protein [Bacteroides sp.]|nr:NTP transferase domain-containing protein [Bacteroides sp.]MBD5320204.1 NTP transferase domain-containing protein [Bacteroides sp.]MBD5350935.1 NTP transferase domain-containing protein [Bacteroides sp.]
MNYAIIAAGEGSRLRNEGVEAPKPLVPLNGMPMIGRLIDIFIKCGAETISVIVNEQMTQVRDYLEQLAPTLPVELKLVVKSTPSSMHSFYEVSRLFDGKRYILTTVDTIFREDDFRRYAEAFERAESIDGMMAVTDYIDDEKPLYIEVNDQMRITAFCDAPFPGVKYISGGIYGLDGRALEVLRECIDSGVSRMRNFQRALVAAGLNLQAYPFGKIIDVDHQEDIAKAESFISQ